MTVEKLHLSKRALLARLASSSGAKSVVYGVPGTRPAQDLLAGAGDDADGLRSAAEASSTGSVLVAIEDGAAVILPPFAVEHAADTPAMGFAPLVELLERPRNVAVFLLRLGGFTVGYFRGETLVASKTDQRFVKNRNRKGGQSQRRFERIREKQIDELFKKACGTARETLSPFEWELEHVFLGGDRLTLLAFQKDCTYFGGLGERVMARLLPVAGDPRRASLDAMPREIWSSDIYAAGSAIAWARGEQSVAPEPAT